MRVAVVSDDIESNVLIDVVGISIQIEDALLVLFVTINC